MGDLIVNLFINSFVSLIMIVIGIIMIKRKRPTTFYTGEKEPKLYDESNTKKWNLYHGLMFIIYGALIIVAAIVTSFIDNFAIALFLHFGSYFIPLFIIVIIHTKLEKKYVDHTIVPSYKKEDW